MNALRNGVPTFETVSRCTTCKLDLSEHVEYVEKNLEDDEVVVGTSIFAYEDEDTVGREIEPVMSRITYEICVELLLEHRRGPRGFPGPVGPQGMKGEPGRDTTGFGPYAVTEEKS